MQFGQATLIPKLHGEADYGAALLLQDGGDRGVDSAAQGADGAFSGNFGSNARDGFFDEGGTAPLFLGVADAEEEIAEQLSALFRVIDFDVELDGVDFAGGIFERGDGVVGVAGGAETGGQLADVVAVTVPDV